MRRGISQMNEMPGQKAFILRALPGGETRCRTIVHAVSAFYCPCDSINVFIMQ